MMSLISRFAAVLLAAAAGQEAAAAERVALGTLTQGEVVTRQLTLSNPHDRALRIIGVDLTPPLALGRMPAVIAPKSGAVLRITLDTARIEGDYSGRVAARLDDGSEHEFVIEGRVIPEIEIRPRAAFFVSTAKGAAASAALEIINHGATPIELEPPAAPPGLAMRLEALDPGKRYRLTLEVPGSAEAGRRAERVVLKSTSARKPRIPIGVNVIVRERVHTFPDAIDLGTLRLGDLQAAGDAPKALSQTLMVYQAGGRDYTLRARSDLPLKLATERGPQGDRVQVTVSIDAGEAKPGPIAGSLVLQTNDPEFAEVRVPVRGAILP
jgi:hypothetical protein